MLQSLLFLVVVLICIRMTFLSTPVAIRGGGIFDLQLTNAYRGVAILFVMSQHVGGALGTNILTPLGGIGVAIFLLLSGYGLSESYKAKGLDGWIKKKMIRVWIPFLCTYVIIFALREDCGWIKFVRQVLTIDRSEYWYVDYILRCYMVFYIAYRWLYKYRWWLLGGFALYSFLLTHSGLMEEQSLSFCFGILLSERKELFLSGKKFMMFGIASFVIGLICLFIKQLPEIRVYEGCLLFSFVQLGIKLPLAIGVIFMLWKLPRKWVISPLLLLSGTLSYELYLVHWQFIPFVGQYATSALAMIVMAYCFAYGMHHALSLIYFKKSSKN